MNIANAEVYPELPSGEGWVFCSRNSDEDTGPHILHGWNAWDGESGTWVWDPRDGEVLSPGVFEIEGHQTTEGSRLSSIIGMPGASMDLSGLVLE